MLFNTARQNEKESLEQWADRACDLAEKAYRDLPESYVEEQTVIKFCSGLCDRDLAKLVAYNQPKTMEEAMNRAKWIKYSNLMIGAEKKRENSVWHVSESTSNRMSKINENTSLEEVVKALAKQVKDQQENLLEIVHCVKEMGHVRNNKFERNKDTKERVCFRCGSATHFIRDCPYDH